MRRKKKGEIEWLEFELFQEFKEIKQAIFLRKGGCSQGSYDSLNTGFQSGDQKEHVQENIRRIHQIFEEESRSRCDLIAAIGCHGNQIALVEEKTPKEIAAVDGLITQMSGKMLMMRHADCQVALIYDPIKKAIANVHAGWRGSSLNIYKEAISFMKHTFDSHPANLLVGITPSLGPEEAQFIHYQRELPKPFWDFQPREYYFDFWAISRFQLEQEGVLPHHIEIAHLSTYQNPHDFYSYRRDKITGRHATCFMIVPENRAFTGVSLFPL